MKTLKNTSLVNSLNSPARVAEKIQEVRDELALYPLNTAEKYHKLISEYNSDICQSMHARGKIFY